MSEKKEFTGSDVADAIKTACENLNASQENLEIEVLHTGSAGIFGLCRRKARILVSVKETLNSHSEARAQDTGQKRAKPTQAPSGDDIHNMPSPEATPLGEISSQQESHDLKAVKPVKAKREEPARTDTGAARKKRPSKKQRPGKPVKSADDSETRKTNKGSQGKQPSPAEVSTQEEYPSISPDSLEKIKADLNKLLELMGFPSQVAITAEQNKIIAGIAGEHIEGIVGPEGQTLDSIQYLFRKKIGKDFPQKLIFSLDAGEFRAARATDLENTALRLAKEVKETGKTRTIRALNPAERRIVHMTLQDDSNIRSRSIGDGVFKKVLIYLPGKGRKINPGKEKVPKNSASAKKRLDTD